MAYKENETLVSYEASTDLSGNQYQLVSLNSSGQLALTGDGARAIGVLQNKPDAQGKAGTVTTDGKARVKVGASITQGGVMASDSNGKAVDAASGDWIQGEFVEDASAADEVTTVELQLNTGKAPV